MAGRQPPRTPLDRFSHCLNRILKRAERDWLIRICGSANLLAEVTISHKAIPTALTGGLPSADELFCAFSDPARMRILNALAPGELCVCDLVSLLELPQSTVSRHLAHLRRSNLVEVRRSSRFAYYRLATAKDPFHGEIIDCIHRCFPKIRTLSREREAAAARREWRREHPCGKDSEVATPETTRPESTRNEPSGALSDD